MKIPVYKYSYDKDPIGYLISPDITYVDNDIFFLPLISKKSIEFRIINGDEGAKAVIFHKYDIELLTGSEFFEPLDAASSSR